MKKISETDFYSWWIDDTTQKVKIKGYTCYISINKETGEKLYALIKEKDGIQLKDGSWTGVIVYWESTFEKLILKINKNENHNPTFSIPFPAKLRAGIFRNKGKNKNKRNT